MLNTLDMGALTIPIFMAIFGLGWASAVRVLVQPMREKMIAMEAKLTQIEHERDLRLARLEGRRINR